MTVRDLVAKLLEFDQNLPVITTSCSDFRSVEADDLCVIEAHLYNGEWKNFQGHYFYGTWPDQALLDPPSPVKCLHFHGGV